jgi:T-complex protein 1 subunit eta
MPSCGRGYQDHLRYSSKVVKERYKFIYCCNFQGPRGMDKLIQSDRTTTISNDGATILNLLDIVHPAAKTLVDIAKAQDNEVGDGTTTVTLLAVELLKESKNFIEDGMHSQIVIKGYREALNIVRKSS